MDLDVSIGHGRPESCPKPLWVRRLTRAEPYQPADSPPEWRYYEILMNIREKLKNHPFGITLSVNQLATFSNSN